MIEFWNVLLEMVLQASFIPKFFLIWKRTTGSYTLGLMFFIVFEDRTLLQKPFALYSPFWDFNFVI